MTIELPSGSRVHGAGQSADFRSDGRLGECRITTGLGNIRLDRTDAVTLRTGVGEISVERATGHAEVTSGSGEVRLRELDASGVIKNSNGDTWVGVVGGDVRLSAANGSIAVDLANAGVVAKTANGDVRLGEVVRGSVVLETRIGDVELGIREGAAAWLDLSATAGRVDNALDPGEPPDPAAETVEVRARTSVGKIAIRRSRRAIARAPAGARRAAVTTLSGFVPLRGGPIGGDVYALSRTSLIDSINDFAGERGGTQRPSRSRRSRSPLLVRADGPAELPPQKRPKGPQEPGGQP